MVEILGWQTRGATVHWEGIPVHPTRRDMFGADVLLGYLHRFRPDLIVSLADVWWMSFMADPQIQAFLDRAGARWVHYYPVDGATADGTLPDGWVNVLRHADVPVAMSRFGVEVSRACGVDAMYVPHGVDTTVFAPATDKAALKRSLGYGDAFVVLSDARNQPRKMLPRTVDVIRALTAARDDVIVHLHCDPHDPAARSDLYSYSIVHDLERAGLLERVRFTDGFSMRPGGGLAMADLGRLYAAADAHLLCSWGEGFGLPTLQAASAGVIPIAVDQTASRELVEGAGVPVPAISAMCDEFGLVRYLLDVPTAVDALVALHDDPGLLASMSTAARTFALGYDWDVVAGQWIDVFTTAPPRRRPVRSRTFVMTAGERPVGASAPQSALSSALADLPAGVHVEVAVTERRWGEAAARVRAGAFVDGHELSVPVRLAPAVAGLPKARVGWVMAGPASLPALAAIQKIFPAVQIAITTPDADPDNPARVALDDLLGSLARYSLVVDVAGDACPGIDLACAVLGVPYLGASRFWPPVDGIDDVDRVRALLTDQPMSEWRRHVARAAIEQAIDAVIVSGIERAAGVRTPAEASVA